MYPPFKITAGSLNLCAEINRLLGRFEGLKGPIPQPQLRKKNRIKTIFSSLAIEGNQLTEQQVTDLVNHKRVIGPQKDILEVKNAIMAYDLIHSYKVNRLDSLLKAHQTLLNSLAEDAGFLRSRNVGIFQGTKVAHMAPKHQLVPKLMGKLFNFLKRKDNLNPLIKSSVFHYELEFIHPFSDGNGRMGRLWQTVILRKYHPLFEYIPVESIIREKQKEYYRSLAEADKAGNSTRFIEFMLKVILQAVSKLLVNIRPQVQTAKTRLRSVRDHFQKKLFSRKDYLAFHKDISTATASRDLLFGIKHKIINKSGARALTQYRF
ncbi:MAG: Fic family protein [Candidatus Margulisiibacteriota bacterium]|nr:Fic family protein [Candidatus Margulisiibacteriota bacterium]